MILIGMQDFIRPRPKSRRNHQKRKMQPVIDDDDDGDKVVKGTDLALGQFCNIPHYHTVHTNSQLLPFFY